MAPLPTMFQIHGRLIGILAASGLAVCAIGCGTGSEPGSTVANANSTPATTDRSQAAAAPEPAIALAQLGLDDSQSELGPNAWSTERISDRLNARLKQLAKLISARRIDEQDLAALVSEDFRVSDLRPKDRTVAFQDETLRVERVTAATQSRSHQGSQGLARALEALLVPARGASDIEVSFKIFGINVSEEKIETTALFQLYARMPHGTLQQNATWKCVWRDADGSGRHRLRSIAIEDFEEVVGQGADDELFVDLTQSVLGDDPSYQQHLALGLDHWLDRIEARFGINISGWQGLAVADVNGDGLEDVYLCQGGGLPNRLFVQNADGTATDRAAESGVNWRDHSHSALLVDLDNDGDADLALATALGLIVMTNDGTGRFKAVAAKSIPEAPPISLAAADFDQDGKLDIFAACYSIRGDSSKKHRFLGRPVPYYDANNGGRNVLFRNEGRWIFRDVTKSVGLDQNNRRFSLAAAWEDYDNDGDLDLYVANDYGRNNLYQNDRGHFTDVAAAAGLEDISAGMSVSWGDLDQNGWMDLYVSNMFSSAGNRIAYQRRFHQDADRKVRSAFQRHARGNSLFLNAGDGSFSDISVQAAVTMGRWAWGSQFVDINNDGWEDLIVANGFITQADPSDL